MARWAWWAAAGAFVALGVILGYWAVRESLGGWIYLGGLVVGAGVAVSLATAAEDPGEPEATEAELEAAAE